MRKLASVGLIAAAMFTSPAMAAWYDQNGAAVHPSRVVHCIRAPDVGSFAGAPFNRPPCEPASWRRSAWRDKSGAVVPTSNVVHCVRAPDVGSYAGGPFNRPPCEPATWR